MLKFQSDPARVRRLLRTEGIEISRDARKRLQWFAYCLDHECNVSLTCRYFGIARSTFVRWATRFDPLDPETLEEHSRRPKHFREPETPEATVALIKSLREAHPHMSRAEIVKTLKNLHGVTISEASVGRVIRRYALFFANTPSHARKRREIEPLPLSQDNISVCGDATEESGETDGLSFAPSTTLALILTAVSLLLGGVLTPWNAYASDSEDFLMNDDSNSTSESVAESDSYQIEDASMTWDDSTGESESYSQGAPDEDDGSDDAVASDDTGASVGNAGSDGGTSGGGSATGGGRRIVSDVAITSAQTGDSAAPSESHPSARIDSHDAETPSQIDSHDTDAPLQINSPFATSIHFDPSLLGMGPSKARPPQPRNTQYNYAASLPNFFNINDSQQVVYGARSDQSLGALLPNTAKKFMQSASIEIALLTTNIVTYATLIAGYFFMRTQSLVLVSEDALLSALRAGKHKLPTRFRSGRRSKNIRKKTKRVHPRKRSFKRSVLAVIIAISILAGTIDAATVEASNTTVPQKIIYNGQLKSSSGQAITQPHMMRFSFWSDTDAVPADLLGNGNIDITRPNYAGWQEIHLAKPNASGYFSLNLGSGTSLPALSTMTTEQLMNLHMQVEVKQVSQPNTSFQIMDVNPSTVIDRTPIRSVPFALNADLFDQRDTGTASGSIAVIGPGNVYPTSVIPGGTDSGSFIIDKDSTETSTIKLQFGQTIGKALSYDMGAELFNFSDDVRIQGDLTVTGLINGVDLEALVLPLKVSSGAGLNVDVSGGSYRINGDITNFAGQGNVSVNDNTTNYLFFGSGGLKVSTVGTPSDESAIPLATVVTSGGAITSVTDRRVLLNDDRERSVSERYSAGFEHVVFQGDAGDNVGQMSEQHDSSNIKNYYQWTSTNAALQDYDIVVRVPIPEDFTGWLDNPLQVQYRSTSADSANSKLDITVFDTNGTPVTLSGSTADLANTSWTTGQIEFTGTPTWTPATEFLIKFKVSARDNFQIHLAGFLLKFRELLTD